MKLTMQGRLDPCFLLSYALPENAVEELLPKGIHPLTYQGFAFINIVISRILKMRPAGMPALFGLTYWHIAYRLYARVDLASDRTMAGLYFLRSDIDKSLMVLPGNALTDFRFHKASIQISTNGALIRLRITQTPGAIADAEAVIEASATGEEAILPPFQTAHEREQTLKYAPFGLAFDRSGHWLKIAEVQRDESKWEERPVRVQMADWRYLKRTIPGEACLVRATQVMPIDYRWCIGRIERL
jgi:uncharacterized protein YqjF (DUF2071 family)